MNSNNPQPRPDIGDGFRKFMQSPWIYLVILGVLLMLTSVFMPLGRPSAQEIPYSEFLQMAQTGQVEEVLVSGDQLRITPVENGDPQQPDYYLTTVIYDYYLVEQLRQSGVKFSSNPRAAALRLAASASTASRSSPTLFQPCFSSRTASETTPQPVPSSASTARSGKACSAGLSHTIIPFPDTMSIAVMSSSARSKAPVR